LIFQSITIGGGYGTGRELVEFFLKRGPLDGLKGMLVAALIWSLILAITFELARLTQSFDYRSFIKTLLGRGWWAYEVVYGLGMVLVISVVGSASGEILTEMTGIANIWGILLMCFGVGILAFAGSIWIERILSFWSIALYVFYFALVLIFMNTYSESIFHALKSPEGDGDWLLGGVKYAAYNVGIVPAMLYVVRHLHTQREALLSGGIAGILTMIPGFFIYLAMLSQYPGIENEVIPANYLMGQMGIPGFQLVFQVILFGTLVETGVGIIHGFNERISGTFKERGKEFSGLNRLLIAGIILLIAIYLADVIGLVELIAKGYGALTWGYWIVFLVPVLTYGTYLIVKGMPPKEKG
ncbi:MAG: hypothetical protein AAF694_22685, partial [Bacteroidota bacterium]